MSNQAKRFQSTSFSSLTPGLFSKNIYLIIIIIIIIRSSLPWTHIFFSLINTHGLCEQEEKEIEEAITIAYNQNRKFRKIEFFLQK